MRSELGFVVVSAQFHTCLFCKTLLLFLLFFILQKETFYFTWHDERSSVYSLLSVSVASSKKERSKEGVSHNYREPSVYFSMDEERHVSKLSKGDFELDSPFEQFRSNGKCEIHTSVFHTRLLTNSCHKARMTDALATVASPCTPSSPAYSQLPQLHQFILRLPLSRTSCHRRTLAIQSVWDLSSFSFFCFSGYAYDSVAIR